MDIKRQNKLEVVTYHYVVPDEAARERTLNKSTFIRQLDFFEQSGGIVTRDEWFAFVLEGIYPEHRYLLTFDDGLACHFEVVAPLLYSRSLFAVFFISSRILEDETYPLEVHLLHYLLQNYDAKKIFSTYTGMLPTTEISTLEIPSLDSLYKNESNPITTWLKLKVNYAEQTLASETALRKTFVALSDLEISKFKKMWYMNLPQIKQLISCGFEIGGHAKSHKLLPLIPQGQLIDEIDQDKKSLELLIEQEVHAFAYPFGGETSFNPQVVLRVKEAGYKVAFTTIEECLKNDSFQNEKNLLLPRQDCNNFT